MNRFILTTVLLFVLALAHAQKPALDHSVCDSWKILKSMSLPQNGDVLMYTITPGEGDATLVIENIRTGKRIEIPRAMNAKLTQDGSKAVALIKPLFTQTREAKIKKKKDCNHRKPCRKNRILVHHYIRRI